MIKIDLHIHSSESAYKEVNGIVDNSTVENAELLMGKLQENEVAMFSITDHNRFNVELYERLDELINLGQYNKVKGLLAGVEFDVKFDIKKCHIITIFDAKNKKENYNKIKNAILKNGYKSKNEWYEVEEFEKLLNDIGLNTILIACQRGAIDNKKAGGNSLSDAANNTSELIEIGYISALEYQKPRVEGIIKDSLKGISKQVLLVAGSDCHDWEYYPYHDKNSQTKDFKFFRANILPTFKGLMMAISSPQTRINRNPNKNNQYIHGISINNKEIKLKNGLNAIVGENGSGKSSILFACSNKNQNNYIAKIINDNNIKLSNVIDSKNLYYCGQGEIVENFAKNDLFNGIDCFENLNNDMFEEAYKTFARELYDYINYNIEKDNKKNEIEELKISYDERFYTNLYYINIKMNEDFCKGENKFQEPLTELSNIYSMLETLFSNRIFDRYNNEIGLIKNNLKEILQQIDILNKNIIDNNKIKNIIYSKVNNYKNKIAQESSTYDMDVKNYKETIGGFKEKLLQVIKINALRKAFPQRPKKVVGISHKEKNGFSFIREANYNNKDIYFDFIEHIFVKEYQNEAKLKSINTMDKLIEAIYGCTKNDNVEEKYFKAVNSFIENKCRYQEFIKEGEESTCTGNTLGEMSLAYLKFLINNKDVNVLLIDQPEDHISNKNINEKLIQYLNSIRYTKQVIFVTHNPLLVVNLDVDNVIFVEKKGDKINTISGCLEKEEDDVNMLDIIAKNMDGGKDAILRRIKIYE